MKADTGCRPIGVSNISFLLLKEIIFQIIWNWAGGIGIHQQTLNENEMGMELKMFVLNVKCHQFSNWNSNKFIFKRYIRMWVATEKQHFKGSHLFQANYCLGGKRGKFCFMVKRGFTRKIHIYGNVIFTQLKMLFITSFLMETLARAHTNTRAAAIQTVSQKGKVIGPFRP